MAGARPSTFKKGGGRLNEVDGTIAGYEFTDVFPFESKNPRKKKSSDFRSLFCSVQCLADGAEEAVIEPMFVGSADDFEISEDGLTLTPVDDGIALRQGANFQRFIASLVEAGFPEDLLPEDEINFEGMIGTRVRFVQRIDEQANAKRGKRPDKSGKPTYDNTYTAVDQVYALPGAASTPASKGKGAAKSAAKPASKAAAAKNGTKVAAPVADDAVIEFADELLVELLAENNNALAKSKLSVKSLLKLAKDDRREDVRKLFFSDDYLARENGWAYDKAKQQLSLEV